MPMSAARLAGHPQLREASCAAVEGPLAKHEISRRSASVASGPLADSKTVTATAASLHRAVGMPTSGMFEGSLYIFAAEYQVALAPFRRVPVSSMVILPIGARLVEHQSCGP